MLKKIGKMKTIQTTAKRKAAPKQPAGPNITDHSYSPETGHLTVTFHHGGRYTYHDVPADVAEDFRASGGSGSFLHRHVIGKFDATRHKD